MVLSYLRNPSSTILNTSHSLSPLTQTLRSVLKDFLKTAQLHSTKVEQMGWVSERSKKSEIYTYSENPVRGCERNVEDIWNNTRLENSVILKEYEASNNRKLLNKTRQSDMCLENSKLEMLKWSVSRIIAKLTTEGCQSYRVTMDAWHLHLSKTLNAQEQEWTLMLPGLSGCLMEAKVMP